MTDGCVSLWRAVVWGAVSEFVNYAGEPDPNASSTAARSYAYNARLLFILADRWLFGAREEGEFFSVCDMAGLNPDAVRRVAIHQLNDKVYPRGRRAGRFCVDVWAQDKAA